MTGSEVVQIVSLVLTAVVSVVSLLVRARIIGLEEQVRSLNLVVTEANRLIISQGLTISQLSQEKAMTAQSRPRDIDKPLSWQGNPPYRTDK